MGIPHKGRVAAGVALILAAALGLSGCASSPPRRSPFLLHPVPPSGIGYELSAGAVLYRDREVEAQVRPTDPRYLAESLAVGGLADPFAVPREPYPPLIILEIRIRNVGREALYFNPEGVRGLDETGGRYYPLVLTDLYRLHRDDPQREARLASFSLLAFSGQVQLQPGQEVKRYLAMAARGEVPASLAVNLPLLHGGSRTSALTFLFEVFPADLPGP